MGRNGLSQRRLRRPLELHVTGVAPFRFGAVPLMWLQRNISWLQQHFSRKLGLEHGQQGKPNCPWWGDSLVYREAYLQGIGPPPETPNNRDYHSLIARAVAALKDNTLAARQVLYNRARIAQTARLNCVDPALSMAEMSCECEALEHAIRLVEFELATGVKQGTRASVVGEQKTARPCVAPGGIKQKVNIGEPAQVGPSSIVPLRHHLRHRQRG